MQYLIRPQRKNPKAHIWRNGDTACRMYSTGGIKAKKRYVVIDSLDGHDVCGTCLTHVTDADREQVRRDGLVSLLLNDVVVDVRPTIDVKLKSAKKKRKKEKPKLRKVNAGFVATNEFLLSFEWRKLRMEAIKVYGARCQCCGATPRDGIVINVDHIKPRRYYPELALEINNLQVLCNVCNHGKGNHDMTDWR